MTGESERATHKPLILVADTSQSRTSIALSEGRRLIGVWAVEAVEKRSATFHSEVDMLLARAGRSITEVDCFAVITGPGSFTGLRVGIASMKGLAAATGKKMASLSTLEATARTAGPSSCTCVMLDASRKEVFTQLFAVNEWGEATALSKPAILTLEEAIAGAYREQCVAGSGLVFAGDATAIYSNEIAVAAEAYGQTLSHGSLLTLPIGGWIVKEDSLLVAALASYAYGAYCRGELLDPDAVVADYIRPAEAELKLKSGLLSSKSG